MQEYVDFFLRFLFFFGVQYFFYFTFQTIHGETKKAVIQITCKKIISMAPGNF